MKAKPLADLIGRAMVPDTEGEELERQRSRWTEAREVRDRLPHFLRAAPAKELEARIAEPSLLEVAQRWQWGGGNVILCGPTRTGKTTAAAYLFRRLLSQAVKHGGEAWELAKWMRWHSAADVSTCRRIHPLGEGDPSEITESCNARLLFLDDAGWDRDPAEVRDVLAARYERGWPTVITTGKTQLELTAHYGAAVVARITEAGGKLPTLVDCFPVSE